MSSRKIETLRKEAAALPDGPGVYVFKDENGEEIYVGKAVSLRKRVRTYFERLDAHDEKTRALVENVHDIEATPTDSEVEALLLENRLAKELQPRYNVQLKDAKDFPYLAITWAEDFPRVYVTRDDPVSGNRYYGPFVSAKELRAAVRALQRVFRFRICKLRIEEGAGENRFRRPCLNYYIGRCTGPCAGRVDKAAYRENIKRFSSFVAGKRQAVIAELEGRMKAAAAKREYEEAALLRDQLRALERLGERGTMDDLTHPIIAPVDLSEGLDNLAEKLGLARPPRLIEGMDISNLGSGEMVGVVVTFADGMPQRGGYRRFRIKTVAGQDDFAAMREVASRRYRRLKEEGGVMPDIVLVDGGKGQLAVVAEAVGELGIEDVEVLSIAKDEEKVFRAKTMDEVAMTARSAGKRLLQYVRDEAHRFAQHYHHILRRKFVLGEGRRR